RRPETQGGRGWGAGGGGGAANSPSAACKGGRSRVWPAAGPARGGCPADAPASPTQSVISMNQRARLDPVPIPFIDLAAQRRRLGRSVDEAIARVLGHCQFILGPELRPLEAELAAVGGARHAVTCASGTDALV